MTAIARGPRAAALHTIGFPAAGKGGLLEFVLLTASLMSLVAFAVYSILPAFPRMIEALGIADRNSIQYSISLLYLGMAFGQLLSGPLSDRFGRKRIMSGGLGLFFAGCTISMLANGLPLLLVGQTIQGLGLGAPRIVTVAMIRDQYSGRNMARVMSFVLIVFTLVPTVSPALGQAIVLLSGWRAVYQTLLGLGVLVLFWFLLRQPETLAVDERIRYSARRLGQALREICLNRIAMGYTLVSGLVTGAFIAYLNLSQPILQEQYGLGTDYPTYFALFAISISSASFLNGKLVVRLGMLVLSRVALVTLTGVSMVYCGIAYVTAGHPPLWTFLLFLMIVLFCFGILVGNLNALALEPLGHVAGMGAAFVGSLSTIISLPLAILIGETYAGSVLPLVAGFAGCGTAALVVLVWMNRGRDRVFITER